MNKIYAVKDEAMGYQTVFTAPNDKIAMRNFKALCETEGSQVADYPESFTLMGLGELDSNEGIVNVKEEFLAKATSFVTKDK